MPTVPSLPLPPIDAKPFYAYVGAGDAALTTLRTRAAQRAELLKTVPATLKTVPDQLKTATAQLQEQVKGLPVLASTLPAQVKELQATVEKRYSEFASRGEKVVAELRGAKATEATVTKPAPKKPVAKKNPKATATTPATAPTAAATPTPTVPAPATPTGVQAANTNGVPSQTPTS